MTRHTKLPAPVAFTAGDRLRLSLGALMFMLGLTFLWRVLPLGVTPQALLVGACFVGFGIYRLWLGHTRLRDWKRGGGRDA